MLSQSRIRVRAAGIIFQQNRLLILEHTKGEDSYWVLPGGGVEFGESSSDALVREIHEELGLSVRVNDLLFCDDVLFPDRHILDLYFSCSLFNNDPVILEKRTAVTDYRFAERSELIGLDLRPPLQDVLEGLFTDQTRLPFRYQNYDVRQ